MSSCFRSYTKTCGYVFAGALLSRFIHNKAFYVSEADIALVSATTVAWPVMLPLFCGVAVYSFVSGNTVTFAFSIETEKKD